jgi:c-di-GMP-binding flagellar brake protein YcgR
VNKNIGAERRQYPRIEQRLPLEIAANGYDFATATQNISCVGAYCRIAKYIPPFTKVMVKLNLPIASGNAKTDSSVECKGVVVRTEDKEGGFNIAIFFNEIRESQRNKIARYVSRLLPHS